jgi:hypothetical protein
VDAADSGADTSNQFACAEGLGDVIISTELERLYFLVFSIEDGKHEDGKLGREGAKAAKGLDAADARHVDIKQDYVEGSRAQHLQRFFTANCFSDVKPEFGEGRTQRSTDRGFVIDD